MDYFQHTSRKYSFRKIQLIWFLLGILVSSYPEIISLKTQHTPNCSQSFLKVFTIHFIHAYPSELTHFEKHFIIISSSLIINFETLFLLRSLWKSIVFVNTYKNSMREAYITLQKSNKVCLLKGLEVVTEFSSPNVNCSVIFIHSETALKTMKIHMKLTLKSWKWFVTVSAP